MNVIFTVSSLPPHNSFNPHAIIHRVFNINFEISSPPFSITSLNAQNYVSLANIRDMYKFQGAKRNYIFRFSNGTRN